MINNNAKMILKMFAKLFSARLADYARAEGGDWSQRSSLALEESQRLSVSPCTSPAIRQPVRQSANTESSDSLGDKILIFNTETDVSLTGL